MLGWDPTFSLLKIVTQKDACPASSGTWRLTLIQKGGMCPLSLLPLMTEFSVFMPLQGIAPGNSWTGGVSLKDCKVYMENKNKRNENKIILEDFNCTMEKIDRDGEKKTNTLLALFQLCLVKSHRG